MTFTNTQTKLGQAITTNASGDYAVRTIIEGDQTLDDLVVGGTLDVTGLTSLDGGLGADLDAKGKYILNDQQTTNMMSKGTVYWFDKASKITIPAIPIGTGAFYFSTRFSAQAGTSGSNRTLLNTGTSLADGLWLVLSSTNDIELRIDATVHDMGNFIPSLGVEYSLLLTRTSAGAMTLYINGVSVGTGTSTVSITTAGAAWTIGSEPSTYVRAWLGTISDAVVGNFAPTASEVKDLISGNIPFHYQWGSQTAQTSGTLEIGQTYIIDDWITADDFTNVGGLNVDGTIFVATGTTPTTWANSSSLRPLGAVALYDQTSISETYWGDVANNNDGAVTGATVLNQPDGMAFKNIILSPVGQDATPKEGQLIYNSATNKLNVWTGAAWEVVTSA